MKENTITTQDGKVYKVYVENSYGIFEMYTEDDKGDVIKDKNELIKGFSEIFPKIEHLNVIANTGEDILLFKDTLKKSILVFEEIS